MNAKTLPQFVHDVNAHALSDARRRELLVRATTVTGGIGLIAAAYPFAASFAPSERAKAEGGPVDADISGLRPGQLVTVGAPGRVLRGRHLHPPGVLAAAARRQPGDPGAAARELRILLPLPRLGVRHRRAGHQGRAGADQPRDSDRKSTRLNSSHQKISYAVFCL